MPEKILIIDDDLDTLKLVGLMLQKQGFQIAAASSGQQGIDMALAESPDLIVLDIMMPGMDGYEVSRRLRANEKTLNIPILMFTAKSQLDDKVTGFEAGADDYITKPTHPTELQAHVRALLVRSSKNKLNPPSRPVVDKPAYSIGVMAARGGLGVTTVASNLAVTLGNRSKVDVILAEFRPGQGTLCYDLGLEKMVGLTELLNLPANEIGRQGIDERLAKLHEGVNILAASAQPKDAALLENIPQFEAILHRLEFMARYVVVDLGCGLTKLNQKLALAFNELIVVVEPYENSLQHAQNLLNDLLELGVNQENLFVVVNYRLRSDTPQLSVKQIQSYIKTPIDVSFTPAPELHLQAARMHLLVSITSLESVTAVQFSSLAQKIESRNQAKTVKI
ncbi:MAG TPA: response regulator [Anaerolineales bacterium]|jgi:DNA-binding response OmpR family regulator